MIGWRTLTACVAAAVLCRAIPARAQFQFGAEALRERVTYHFDNPSSINTDALVPHFFEQAYTRDNVWLTAAASYRAGGDWLTTAGATAPRDARATDYDTFFNPDGSTWVAGTTGDARMHGWRLGQWATLGKAGPVRLTAGYQLQVDSADFFAGDRTVTRDSTLVSRAVVTTREFTTAIRHEFAIRGAVSRTIAPRWQLRVSGEVAPVSINRLSIQLPDTYPGQTLVFQTTTLSAQATADVVRSAGGWPIAFGMVGGGTVPYHATERVTRRTIGVKVTMGRTW